MILVAIPQSGNQPTIVAFASHSDFCEFVHFFRGEFSVQYVEDGGNFVNKLRGRLDAMTEEEADTFAD